MAIWKHCLAFVSTGSMVGWLVLACAARANPAAATQPPASKPAPAPPAKAPAPAAPTKPAPKAPAAEAPPAAAPAGKACPGGMQLVDGEYCTDVDYKCLKSWYDESNKKTVCEEFEPVSKCVGTKVHKRFCMDTYTWPNTKGERPEVMNRFHEAQIKCAAVGKRLCTESEWTMACEGPKLKPFPYGYMRDASKCHGDVEWDAPQMNLVAKRDPRELARLWKGVRNGSQPSCISDYGVADLPGNVDEVTSSEQLEGWRAKYDSVNTGGPWYKGVRNQCRPKIYTHDEGFYYYFLGFRCCAEADAKPTDPRTPRQIKQGWNIKRVERLAGFGVEEMKRVLELKRTTPGCNCKERDIRCKTMCGTLLGPEAKDYVRAK
jgi:formylglycine-generating enzyme